MRQIKLVRRIWRERNLTCNCDAGGSAGCPVHDPIDERSSSGRPVRKRTPRTRAEDTAMQPRAIGGTPLHDVTDFEQALAKALSEVLAKLSNGGIKL
jgi:hypothetical protein